MPSPAVLGSAAPGAVDTALYTVPSVGNAFAVGNLFVTNTGSTVYTFRVSLDADGGTGSLAAAEAIYYDCPIGPNETVEIKKICLQTGAKIWVRGSNSAVNFNMTGLRYWYQYILDLPKVLGASNGSSGSDTLVYTVPTSATCEGAVFKVFICNTGTSSRTFRVYLDDSTVGTVATAEAIYYDTPIGPNETVEIEGLALQPASRLYYRASSTDITCVVTGTEIVKTI